MSASLFSSCSGKFLADDIAKSFTQEIVDCRLRFAIVTPVQQSFH